MWNIRLVYLHNSAIAFPNYRNKLCSKKIKYDVETIEMNTIQIIRLCIILPADFSEQIVNSFGINTFFDGNIAWLEVWRDFCKWNKRMTN